MDDKYPSNDDEQQSVHLDFAYPDVPTTTCNRYNAELVQVEFAGHAAHFIALFFVDYCVAADSSS